MELFQFHIPKKHLVLLVCMIAGVFFGTSLVATAYFEGWLRTPGVSPRTAVLYYYDSSRDVDKNGEVRCSAEGLVPVERIIMDDNPVHASIRALMLGELTAAEREAGITTEYPLDGIRFSGTQRRGDTITVSFENPFQNTVSGSCRARILRAQLEETLKQFDGISEVRLEPQDIFAAGD